MPGIVQIAGFLNAAELDIIGISDQLLQPDHEAPDGTLFNSGVMYSPDSPSYNRLATGDVMAQKVKYWDEGDLFGEWGSGAACPTDCGILEQVEDRAALQIINRCLKQEHAIRICSGDNEEDWMKAMISWRTKMLRVEAERRAICSMLGVYNQAVAQGGMSIIHDFTVTPLDGTTTSFTMAGLNSAGGLIYAEKPDVFLAPLPVTKRLEREGFVPFCCTESGQKRNEVQALIGPKGEIVIIMPKRFTPLFTLGANLYLVIGATRNSVVYKNGTPAEDTESFNTFRSQVIDDDPCNGTTIYWWQRIITDIPLWAWKPAAQFCDSTIDHAALAAAASWEYAPNVDPTYGADRSKLSFFVANG